MEKISYRVLKQGEFDGENPSIFYQVSCSCSDDRDIITLELEYDDWDDISLSIYQQLMWSSYWGFKNWFQRVWYRISGALTILFTGEIKVEGSITLQGEKHIQSLIDALEEGKLYVKQFQDKEKKNAT